MAAAAARRVRIAWAACALALIAALGALIAWLPRTPAEAPAEPRAAHAYAMGSRELEARFAQGVVMLHAKQFEHALTAFHRVLELAPQMPEAHANLGFALIGLKRWQAARDFFESALALRRDQLNAYYGLALALEGMGDLTAARGAMRTYAHLAPRDDPYRRKAEAALWEWEAGLAGPGRQPAAAAARPD